MKGRTFKRCPCPTTWRTEASGKRVKASCKKDHGSWSFVHDGPERFDGKRRQVKRGGFRTQTEAQDSLTQSLASVANGEFVDTGRAVPTVGEYLDGWLVGKRGQAPAGADPVQSLCVRRTGAGAPRGTVGVVRPAGPDIPGRCRG